MMGVKKRTANKPTIEIIRDKYEVTIKCNGDTIKFKDDNVEVTRARRSGNCVTMNKIRESVFTGYFLEQNSSNMYHNFSTDL